MKSSTSLLAALAITLLPTLLAGESVVPAQPVLRFAVLGDAEPKPEPRFPHMAAAIDDINALTPQLEIDFVVGVGDIAHKGTLVQYEAATLELQRLILPFYPIMGNEEHGSTVQRYLDYVQQWNAGKTDLAALRYVLNFDHLALVFASPDFSRDFNDDGIDWILQQLEQAADKPVMLIVHGAQAGAFPENPEKGVHHPRFSEILAHTNLAAVISGDLHMDMDRVDHSKVIDGVHHLHIPALERTKIPDESHHTAMFRVFTVFDNRNITVDTYEVGNPIPLQRHAYKFMLPVLQ